MIKQFINVACCMALFGLINVGCSAMHVTGGHVENNGTGTVGHKVKATELVRKFDELQLDIKNRELGKCIKKVENYIGKDFINIPMANVVMFENSLKLLEAKLAEFQNALEIEINLGKVFLVHQNLIFMRNTLSDFVIIGDKPLEDLVGDLGKMLQLGNAYRDTLIRAQNTVDAAKQRLKKIDGTEEEED